MIISGYLLKKRLLKQKVIIKGMRLIFINKNELTLNQTDNNCCLYVNNLDFLSLQVIKEGNKLVRFLIFL